MTRPTVLRALDKDEKYVAGAITSAWSRDALLPATVAVAACQALGIPLNNRKARESIAKFVTTCWGSDLNAAATPNQLAITAIVAARKFL